MHEIDELMTKMKSEKVGFSQIVKKWERKRIVEKFVPLLHLENDGKVETEQEDYFKEIWIKKKF
jgi:chromatin segregation and condensation protein Rec8/ScpA/Scc1 (kleisin family)